MFCNFAQSSLKEERRQRPPTSSLFFVFKSDSRNILNSLTETQTSLLQVHSQSGMVSNHSNNMKFLCSYGGKILPRSSDGKLRYVGGHTRVLAVERSISYSELMVKLVEFCGSSVTLTCPLPNGDLETLITIKSDAEWADIIEEYDRASLLSSKIRAILLPQKSIKKPSPSPSTSPSIQVSSSGSPYSSSESIPQPRTGCVIRRQSFSPRPTFPIVNRHGYCFAGHVVDRSPRFPYYGPQCNNYCH